MPPSPPPEVAASATVSRRRRSRGRSHPAPASEPVAVEAVPTAPSLGMSAFAGGQADDAPLSEMSAFESFRQPELTAEEQQRLDPPPGWESPSVAPLCCARR